MRILHLADVHLDRPFVRADRQQGNRDRARLRQAFVRCLQLAEQHAVDVVTLGGDLWEDEHVGADTRRFVAGELAKLERRVLLIGGNHDPFLPGGNYERTAWPSNVTLFPANELRQVQISSEVSIWGISWGGIPLDPALLAAGPAGAGVHLLLVHGTATPYAGLVDDASYCPFEPDRLRAAGFDYLLVGHIHAARTTELLVYPGSPEPLGWGEMGRHCVALITVEDHAVETALLDVNAHRYAEQVVDCGGCEHSGEVAERIAAEVAKVEDAESLHLRLVLQGEIERECQIEVEDLRTPQAGPFAELAVVDQTRRPYDLDALAQQPTAQGEFVRDLHERIAATADPAERQFLELALRSGLRALDDLAVLDAR